MPDRPTSARPASAHRALTIDVDVVLFAAHGNQLAVLLVSDLSSSSTRARARWSLPSDALRADESLDEAAVRIARDVSGSAAAHLEQAAALGGARRAAEGANVNIAYFGLVPDGSDVRKGAEWIVLADLPALAGRQRDALEAALATMRARVDQQPIAFRLLPAAFTL